MTIDKMMTELTGVGVDVSKLSVFYTGTDQILGEAETNKDYPSFIVKNPKRVIRMQQMERNGLILTYLVSNLDLMQDGELRLTPHAWYRVRDQPEETQRVVFGLYLEFFERRAQQRIAESGLVLPTSPFKK